MSDDAVFAGLLKENLPPSGYDIRWRQTLPSSLRQPGYGACPVIIDLAMPKSIKALSAFRAYHPEAGIIAVANGNFRKTEEALKAGASFVVFERTEENLGTLKETIRRVWENISAREELEALKSLAMPRLVAESAKMKNTIKLAGEAATLPFPESDKPVVLFGPPGSGRELIARHIHLKGRRAAMPFVILVAEEDITRAAMGARGGTLYIKELSALGGDAISGIKNLIAKKELSAAVAHGGNGGPPAEALTIKADVRVMAGCFCPEDISALQGLEYMGIEVPSIGERAEDIIPLANFFIEELSAFLKSDGKFITKSGRQALLEREYPGGVSELKRLVHRAYFLGKERAIGAKDFSGARNKCSFKSFLDERLRLYINKMGELPNSNLYESVMSEVEKALIELALNEMKGNKLRAAKALGMNRNTFRAKIKHLKIKN